MKDRGAQTVKSARGKIRYDIVIQNRRQERTAEKLGKRDVSLPHTFNPPVDQRLYQIEKTRFGQQSEGKEQRKQKIVFGVFNIGFVQGETPHFGYARDTYQRAQEPGNGRPKQRHVIVKAMYNQQTYEW